MSKWRPKRWNNPWSNPDVIVEFDKNFMAMRTADGTTPERVLAEDRRDIFEFGADAMLEALTIALFEKKLKVRRRKGVLRLIPNDKEQIK